MRRSQTAATVWLIERKRRVDRPDHILHRQKAELLAPESGLGPSQSPRHFEKRKGRRVARPEDHRRAKDRDRSVGKLPGDHALEGQLRFPIPCDRRIGIPLRSRRAALRRRATCGLGREDNDAATGRERTKDAQGPIHVCFKILVAAAREEHPSPKDRVGRKQSRPFRGLRRKRRHGSARNPILLHAAEKLLRAANGGQHRHTFTGGADHEVPPDKPCGSGDKQRFHLQGVNRRGSGHESKYFLAPPPLRSGRRCDRDPAWLISQAILFWTRDSGCSRGGFLRPHPSNPAAKLTRRRWLPPPRS